MTVEIISVGTELLMGNIVNTNAAYLAEQCAGLGLTCYYQSVVGDNRERMADTVRRALERSDIILLSGGLGPTEDDLTKEVVCEVMGEELVEDPHTREKIRSYMENFSRDHRQVRITENNWKQAMVPEHGKVLDNENGTAPGLILEKEGHTAILLPGPPNEMIPLFEQQVFGYLESRQKEKLYSHMVKICGIGESMVETRILDLIDAQTNPTIAPYAKTGEVHLRITAKAESRGEAERLMQPLEKQLFERFGTAIYTTSEKVTLEEAVVSLLKKHHLTVTTAESCTGGAIAARIVNVAGASEVLMQGLVTYANEAKERYLGVRAETLAAVGAVSPETACEMADGACRRTGSEVSIATTGIAGPGGGTPEKPVGLVYMGCCVNGKTVVREFHFKGDRAKVRAQGVVAALTLLRECVISAYGE